MRLGDAGRTVVRALRPAVVALLGGLLLVNAAPARYSDPAGVSLTLSVRLPAREGRTVLDLPPLGEVDAATHRFPVELRVRLDRVEPVSLQALAERPTRESLSALQERVEGFVRSTVVRFAVRQTLLAGLGALAALYLAGVRRAWRLAAGALATALAVAGGGLAVAGQYDVDAFAAPRYRGALQAAPQVVEAARMGVEALGDVGERLQRSAAQLAQIYQRLQTAAPVAPSGDELVVAHVSDFHNNPAGFDLLEAVVRQFGVRFVIDTGDMLDLGSDLEPVLTDRIRALAIPYLYVAGNHDTPRLLSLLRTIPEVVVLDGQVVEVAGVRVLGMPDPQSATDRPEALPEEKVAEVRAAVVEAVRDAPAAPDIIAVHNYRVGRSLPPGLAQAVLFGHDHRLALEVRDGTAYVDAGSTGAEGLRGLEREALRPFTLALLHFDVRDGQPRLWAVDVLALDAVSGQLSMERRLVGAAHAGGAGVSEAMEHDEAAGPQGEVQPRVEPKEPDAPRPTG